MSVDKQEAGSGSNFPLKNCMSIVCTAFEHICYIDFEIFT